MKDYNPCENYQQRQITDHNNDNGSKNDIYQAPAKRLLLIVADGLRADLFYENNMGKTPFFKDLIMVQKATSYGVSKTRVPTESRPGHVAIIGGFYEDVSAVTKGWKINPVEFDTVFNRSRETWAFGSPDIIPMFTTTTTTTTTTSNNNNNNTNKHHLHGEWYDDQLQDFSKNAKVLDDWVFDHIQSLFTVVNESSSTSLELQTRLRNDKVIFFLHLLTLDTQGHAFRPKTKEYIQSITDVDAGIAKIVNVIENFYEHDGKTAYIFTSDHGMSDRGNHGDGDPANTRTPIVAWGAGIARNEESFEVEQADLAPLMSSVICASIPVNNVGVLPKQFLIDPLHQSLAVEANARQMLTMLERKEKLKGEQSRLYFKPYQQLDSIRNAVNSLSSSFSNAKESQDVDTIISNILDGLQFYQTYDWSLLMTIVTLGYIGWKFVLILFIIDNYSFSIDSATTTATTNSNDNNNNFNLKLFSFNLAFFTFISFSILHLQSLPTLFYGYIIFPLLFWSYLIQRGIKPWFSLFQRITISQYLTCFIYIMALEFMVLSYFHRILYSYAFLFSAGYFIYLLIFTEYGGVLNHDKKIIINGIASSIFMSIFTFLPVDKQDDIRLIAVGAIACGLLALVNLPNNFIRNFHLILLFAAILIVYDTSYRLETKEGLPVINKLISWLIFFVSLISTISFIRSHQQSTSTSTHVSMALNQRLTIVILGFSTSFALLTISFELLFYAAYGFTMMTWLNFEHSLPSTSTSHKSSNNSNSKSIIFRSMMLEDARNAFLFLFFTNVAFFGTGNIASVASFQLSSTYRFATVFDPWLMGALLIYKLLIPFVIVSSTFSLVTHVMRIPVFALFFLVLVMSDVMALNFFFLVQDKGSWLDIGTSISHFAIMNTQAIFMLLLILLSKFITHDLTLLPLYQQEFIKGK